MPRGRWRWAGWSAAGSSRPWASSSTSWGVPDAGVGGALLGAVSVFMAYEGFQLLTYDYEDIDDPERTLPRALLSAIVIAIYVAVAIGTAMLIGADQVVQHEEVAPAMAGEKALGVARDGEPSAALIALEIVVVLALVGWPILLRRLGTETRGEQDPD